MARITATEMVGVPLTTKEVRRLLVAIAEGKLGLPKDPENVVLQRKLGVLLQIATATENRQIATATENRPVTLQGPMPVPGRQTARRRGKA